MEVSEGTSVLGGWGRGGNASQVGQVTAAAGSAKAERVQAGEVRI